MNIKKFASIDLESAELHQDLDQVSIRKFFDTFGVMDPEEVREFVENPEHDYEVGKFLYYNTDACRWPDNPTDPLLYYDGGYGDDEPPY